ncbi:RHS repeat-associated core domain-containing protein, partial [Pseudomonas alliivorans]|nr:RHS repeat-associated core domain-containing protein [Pseudomonas alliivorans]
QGQYFDAETGLHYNRHRYYNPGTGRFLTPDPIKLAGGLNNYQYVPNPTGWVDPLGLTGKCPSAETCSLPVAAENPARDAHVNHIEPTVPMPSGVGGTGAHYDKVNGQGLYVLKDEAGNVKYVGRGDAPARVAKHADTEGKDDLVSQILWDNNLSKAQAKGLEQLIIDLYGGAKSQNARTPLLNEIRSYRPENPNAPLYKAAGSDELFNETLRRLGQ